MINGKTEEKLCGDGPNLGTVLKQDDCSVKLRRYTMKILKKNFEAATVYIQKFQSLRQFFVENEEESHNSIENETGTAHVS
jgi:hypothetical protein